MKLDPDKLAAEATAHDARMKSPLWTSSDRDTKGDWTAQLNVGAGQPEQPFTLPWDDDSPQQPQPAPRQGPLDSSGLAIESRLDALDRAIARLTDAATRGSPGNDSMPGWAMDAAGDPHAYDAPDSERTGVCVRILPTTYAQIQQVQSKMGLRTTAGAWEFLLRLGLAAAAHMPFR